MYFTRLLTITLALSLSTFSVWAGQITLKSTTSTVELVGELKSFDNGIYIITTELGELEVDARTVTCEGSSCPKAQNLTSEFSMFGDPLLINKLLVPLLESYSFSLDANLETKVKNKTNSKIKVVGKKKQELANIAVQTGTESKLKSKINAAKNALVITSGTIEMLADAAEKTNATPLAANALIAVTSDINPIKSISLNSLHDVLSGKITNWKDLGGPNIDINLYLPEENSDVIQISKKLGYDTPKSVKSQRFSDLEKLSKSAANDPFGLGFTNYSSQHSANALSISGTCGVHIQPTAFNILTGSYPTSYFHYLQTTSTPVPIFAREFISYLNNTQAKAAITNLGYPSLSVLENALDNQGNRIAHGLLTTTKTVPVTEYRAMLNALNGARQLSTVLRFKAGSLDLDTQSSAALEVLISELFLGNYADQKLQIIGFTEADGSTGENKRNSKAAAQLISRYIKDADSGNQLMDLQIEVLGFGEASPLACEDTPEGSAINNRVEIWVKDQVK